MATAAPVGPATWPPSTRSLGLRIVAKPPGTTPSRSLPVARYCGPASTSSATPWRLRRVTASSSSPIASFSPPPLVGVTQAVVAVPLHGVDHQAGLTRGRLARQVQQDRGQVP